jgi:hypothetical protein
VSPMKLMESGIPLSLLLDLVLGPESADLMAQERSAPDGRLVGIAKSRRDRSDTPVRAV